MELISLSLALSLSLSAIFFLPSFFFSTYSRTLCLTFCSLFLSSIFYAQFFGFVFLYFAERSDRTFQGFFDLGMPWVVRAPLRDISNGLGT
jgi:hypothetical protein